MLGADYAAKASDHSQQNAKTESSRDNNADPDVENDGADNAQIGEVNMEDEVINENQKISVISAKSSKSIGHLKKIDVKNYVNSEVLVDENNTFLDNHIYLEVGIALENLDDSPKELYLSGIHISEQLGDGNLRSTDLSVTSTTDGVIGHDTFRIEAQPHEPQTIYLGYVLTEEDFNRAKQKYYLVPDLAGAITIAPEEITMIKLNIEEA